MSMMGMVETLGTCELINRPGVASARLTRPATSSYHCENREASVRTVPSPKGSARSRSAGSPKDAALSRTLSRNFTSECLKKWNNPLTNCRCFQQMSIRAVPMP